MKENAKLAEIGVKSGKTATIQSMLDSYTPRLEGLSALEKEALLGGLSRVDRGVLLWAEREGAKFLVLQPGETLEDAGVLRNLSASFEERIDPEKVAQIHQHLSSLTARIKAETDPESQLSLRRQKRRQLAELLTNNPSGAAVFTPIFAPLLAHGLSKLDADPTETPTMKSLALHHGADSKHEQENFYRWFEKLNGERLSIARQASIQERSTLLKNKPEAQEAWLKRAKIHPELVPLDVTLHTLVVPDAHYFPSHTGEELLLDRSDIRSIEGWQNEDFRGQWFFLEGKNHVLIRDSAVGLDTPVHELGHVVDITLERKAPEFYSKLKPRIERAFHRAKLQNKTISNYSRANPREYIAEGFAAYYTDPGALKSKDPELHTILAEMVEYCCRESGIDPVLDSKLQAMMKDAAAYDHRSYEPAQLKDEFENRLAKTPTARALSQRALTTALGAAQLGLYLGAAERHIGEVEEKLDIDKSETLADSVQLAFHQGVGLEDQREIFELARKHGHRL